MIVSDTIEIAAPADLVWRVTTDVEQWPEWTPTVTSVRLLGDGPLRLGAAAAIKQPLQPVSVWTVVEYEAGRRFVWVTHRTGLSFRGTHDLAAAGHGTRSTLTVEATGLLALLLWPVLRSAMMKALRDENAGLKRKCEMETA